MAAINVLTLSTSLLEFYYENVGLNNSLDDVEIKEALKEFQDALIKARVRNTNTNVEIKWEIDSDPNEIITQFAEEQNQINDL